MTRAGGPAFHLTNGTHPQSLKELGLQSHWNSDRKLKGTGPVSNKSSLFHEAPNTKHTLMRAHHTCLWSDAPFYGTGRSVSTGPARDTPIAESRLRGKGSTQVKGEAAGMVFSGWAAALNSYKLPREYALNICSQSANTTASDTEEALKTQRHQLTGLSRLGVRQTQQADGACGTDRCARPQSCWGTGPGGGEVEGTKNVHFLASNGGA